MEKQIITSDCRFVIVNNKKYMLDKDIAEIIREFAGSEETDVRRRLYKLASNIERKYK